MRTIVHLSDLHFGHIDPDIVTPLIATVKRLNPNVVAVSGDLTQRARSREFQEAKRFLDALPYPQVVVPGNHDVPLYNPFRRFWKPFAKYRRYISENLEPVYLDNEIAVIGINSARALTIKNGRINQEQMASIRQQLCALDKGLIKVIVSHHPFHLPAPYGTKDLIGRAALAMDSLAACGVDILLAGHLHTSRTSSTDVRYGIPGYAALAVQAGTATSTRSRGETNSFNVLRVAAYLVTIERYAWAPDKRQFVMAATEEYVCHANADAIPRWSMKMQN